MAGVAALCALLVGDGCGGDRERTAAGVPADSCVEGAAASCGEAVVADVEALVAEVQGFGERTTGGRGGEAYWVTTLADAGPGSLRAGAEAAPPRWIRFRVSGDVRLASPIRVASDKTIDGRGARIGITGHGLTIDGQSNVILENLALHDGGDAGGAEDDALHIVDRAHDVWVDHCSFSHWGDGLIDVTRESTDITVSWCRFTHHDKVMLIGASPDQPGDAVIRVTLHHNHFEGTEERHPRLRFGKVHAYNNYYDAWGSYGAASSMRGELLSQANVFRATWHSAAIVTHAGQDPEEGYVRSVDDLALGGARIVEREPERVFDPAAYYTSARVDVADERLRAKVAREAGRREVRVAP